MSRNMHVFEKKCKGVFFSILFFAPVVVSLAQGTNHAYGQSEPNLELGEKVYQTYCVICHGEKGDGKGSLGIIHRVKKRGLKWSIFHPRDLTVGVFKFRTTPTGCLPTDEDLMRTITGGVTKSFMPSHSEVTLKERVAVTAYIKTFSTRWEEEEPCDPVVIKRPKWFGSRASVNRGKSLYKEMKCGDCHGQRGMGDGPKANDIKDDWGMPILPFDFTAGKLKRGSSPENIYITFTTGLDGTGMPSYEDSLKKEDRWHLVSYTLELMKLKGRDK